MAETERHGKKKKGMPPGMYIGSALIGFAIFMVLCWSLALRSADFFIQQNMGSVAGFKIILILIPIFGFMIPMLLGIRTLRRAGRQAREEAMLEKQESEP
ncbi:MAG: hypothetical protein M3220_08465 [Chloroflexota bacterium]|nr:hypothetical protein [Chloroflexota bacterium]